MMEWDRTQLGNLLEKIIDNRGKTPPLADLGVELIETTALTGVGKFPDYSLVRRRVSQDTFDRWFRAGHPRKGDILVATVGANIGSAAIMRENRGCVAQNLVGLRADPLRADPDYIYYYLTWDRTQSELKRLDIGAAQPSLKVPHLLSVEIPLPPLLIQRLIASILSAYDELIENSQRRIKILESMARTVYREWFVYFRFPGHGSIPHDPSTIGDISQGWEVMKLGDLCELRKDQYRDSEHSALPLVDMARIPSRSLAPSDTGTPDELATSRILFKKGDTLFGAIRCYLHKVVAVHYPGVTNTSVLVLRPKVQCFRAFLAIVASDADTIRWAEKQSTGTKMPVINWGVFQEMPTPILSKALAQSFEQIAGPMLDEIGILATKIENLRRTRNLLLPRLLSGQIDMEAIAS